MLTRISIILAALSLVFDLYVGKGYLFLISALLLIALSVFQELSRTVESNYKRNSLTRVPAWYNYWRTKVQRLNPINVVNEVRS